MNPQTTYNIGGVASYPQLRFKGFQGEWEKHSLTDFLEFKNGLNPSADKFGKGTKFISVMDILNNSVITYDCIRATVQATEKELQDFSVDYGDILFQRSSETLEDVGQANVYLDEKPALFGGFVIRGKKIGIYDPLFFRYMLSHPVARKKVSIMGAGAQHFNIGQKGLSCVRLNFPSLPEQHLLGTFFSSLDRMLSAEEQKVAKLKQLKAASLQDMFPQEGQNIPKIRFKGFQGDWEEVPFETQAITRRGLTYSPSSLRSQGVRVLRSSNIHDGLFRVDDKEDVFVSEDAINIDYAQNGDILISVH